MNNRRAFTVLELLVVVLIIGLLAGLILPALNRARAAAKRTACLGHLRQLALAVQMYVNDAGGQLPALQNRASITNDVPALDTVLRPYVAGKREVFQCPADAKDLFAVTGTSYFWNFTVSGQDIGKLFSIVGGTEPTRVPLVSDKEGFHADIPDRVLILYADGHVSKELKFSTSLP